MSRMIQLYAHEVGPENHKRITNLVAAYPYLLRQHIRPGCLCSDDFDIPEPHRLLLHEQRHIPHETRHEGQESSTTSNGSRSNGSTRIRTPSSDNGAYDCWVDKRALPWSLFLPQSLPAIARTENRPLWVCDRMAALICQIPYGPNFTSRERLCLLGMVDKLTNAVGQCERIHQTAVPLNYARHSLRSLTLWLFTLPFCLVHDLGLFTAPANAAIAWLFFGVYQIGYSIEDPFQGSLRLSILCDAIRRSVIRQTTDTMDDSTTSSMDGFSGSHRSSDPLWAEENPDSTPSSVHTELLTSASPSSSSNASKIADAIKLRRQEQQQQDRDLKASQHQLEEGCDDNAVVEPLREQRPSPRVTANMAKSLQEEIQQQLYLPTLSPKKKSSCTCPPTTSGSTTLSTPSESPVSPPCTTMTGTTTDSSSSSSLPPSSAAAEPLSPPPPPLWMEEELLQAPKIVRRYANGTWTDVGI
jgi:Bestrophin, RFP-TM, chloride channel